MHSIEQKSYGYKITLEGIVSVDEMKQWVEESRKALAGATKEFGVFVDMRTLKPVGTEAQSAMQEGQKLYKEKGMQRSVVILNSSIMKMQFQRIAKETGIYEWERYVDASSVEDFEKVGLNWLRDAIDPD